MLSFLKEILKLFNIAERKKLFFLIFLILVGTILELTSLGMVLPAVKIFTDKEFLIEFYQFTGIPEMSLDLLIFFVLFSIVAIFAIKNFFLWCVLLVRSKFLSAFQGDLQYKLFKGYLSQNLSFLNGKNSSTIIHNISNLSNFFCSVYLDALILIIIELVILIGILSLLLFYNFLVTLVLLFVFGGCVLLIYLFNKKRLKEIGESRNFYSEKQLENINQGIGGIREIKVLGKEFFFMNNFKTSTNELVSVNYKSSIISGTPRLVIEFLAVLSFSVVIILLTLQGTSLISLLPVLALYFACMYKLLPSFQKILFLMNRLRFSYHTAKQLLILVREIFDNDEIKNNKGLRMDFTNEIEIKNLSFKYPENEKKILSNVNLKIPKNSFIGICGESGAGKSTLIDLILGLQKPSSGSIQVDNIEISENLRNWQNTIGYVPQNIFLISDTIKKNIALGLDENEIDNGLLDQAIEKSNLKEFVETLPKKENTAVGEHGSLISWGQRQRIGIARALYNKPNVLIFDEATSSLDPKTEGEILKEIQLLKKNLTLIFISHKEQSLKDCDKIFSINNGIVLDMIK